MTKKNGKVKISVAMATFNGSRFIREQLNSIFSQSYEVHEVIVCDDFSTDNTIEILREYGEKYNLKYWVNTKNLGFVKNFEKAISFCEGDFIALSDQDDIWFENKIEELVNNIGESLLIHSDVSLIDADSVKFLERFKGDINSHNSYYDYLYGNVCTGCTMMFPKTLTNKILPFPDGIAYHDWFIAISAAYYGKVYYYPKPLIGYRQHSSQNTGAGVPIGDSVLNNVVCRLLGKEFERLKSHKLHLENLKSIKLTFPSENEFEIRFNEAITYLDDYVNNFIHFRFAYIKIKRSTFYQKKNVFNRFLHFLYLSIY